MGALTPRRPARLAPLALGLLLIACSDGFGPAERGALARAEARWAEHAPAAYRFDYELLCFCPTTSARITVRDGAIAAVEAIGESDLPDGHPWPTIDSLFARIRRGADELDDDWTIEVEYDATYGYPVSVDVTAPENIADGGSIERVTNFVPLE